MLCSNTVAEVANRCIVEEPRRSLVGQSIAKSDQSAAKSVKVVLKLVVDVLKQA